MKTNSKIITGIGATLLAGAATLVGYNIYLFNSRPGFGCDPGYCPNIEKVAVDNLDNLLNNPLEVMGNAYDKTMTEQQKVQFRGDLDKAYGSMDPVDREKTGMQDLYDKVNSE